MIKWILTKIVGTKNQREVRRLRPIVEQIVSIEESWNGKGQEFLLEKTREWQGYLHRFLPMDLPPVRIVEAAPREELEEIAAKLNARFESLKEEFASLPTVEATPAKAKQVRRFANYYLPDAVNVLQQYAKLAKQGVRGENAASIRAEVERNAASIATAFENQLDALYAAESMDLSADLTVLQNMLKGQGLSK